MLEYYGFNGWFVENDRNSSTWEWKEKKKEKKSIINKICMLDLETCLVRRFVAYSTIVSVVASNYLLDVYARFTILKIPIQRYSNGKLNWKRCFSLIHLKHDNKYDQITVLLTHFNKSAFTFVFINHTDRLLFEHFPSFHVFLFD